MIGPRRPRSATRWEPYRGLRMPDRPGGGLLVIDRNPYSGPAWAAGVLLMLTSGLCCGLALSVFAAVLNRLPGLLVLSGVLLVLALLMSYGLVISLFSRERLWIDARGLDYLSSDGLVQSRRIIPYPEIRRLGRYVVWVQADRHRAAHYEYGLAIETIGRPLRIGQWRDPEVVDQLIEDIRRNLEDRHPDWSEATHHACEALDPTGMHAEPPSDSRIIGRREWDRTEFRLGLRRWVVRPGEVMWTFGIGGLGWSRTVEIEWLARIELRRSLPMDDLASAYRLALVDLDGLDRAIIGPLTEGEARWMAGIVAEVLKDALPRPGQEIHRWSVSVDEPTEGSRAMADAWLDEPGTKGAATREEA